MRSEYGVTMVEMMAAVSIVAIFMALGIPGMLELTKNNRRDSLVVDIVSSFNLARSEAIKRGHNVSVCPSLDRQACTGNSQWETGWIVFLDPNSNGIVDGGEAILRAREAAGSDITIRNTKNRITYQSGGFSRGFMDTLKVCDSRGKSKGRSVIINMQGRVRIKTGTDLCP